MFSSIKTSFIKSWQGREGLSEILLNYGAIPGLILAIMMVGLKLAYDSAVISSQIAKPILYINIILIYVYLWFLFSFVYRVATNYDLSTRNWVRFFTVSVYLVLIAIIWYFNLFYYMFDDKSVFLKAYQVNYDKRNFLITSGFLSSLSALLFLTMNTYFTEAEINRENKERLANLDLKYASSIKRFLAFVIDIAIVTGMCFVIKYLPFLSFSFRKYDDFNCSMVILVFLYFSILPATKLQGTIGMFVAKVKMTDKFGEQVSVWRSAGRFVCHVVISCLLFLFPGLFIQSIPMILGIFTFIGFAVLTFSIASISALIIPILSIFTKERLVTYDFISRTRVIER